MDTLKPVYLMVLLTYLQLVCWFSNFRLFVRRNIFF